MRLVRLGAPPILCIARTEPSQMTNKLIFGLSGLLSNITLLRVVCATITTGDIVVIAQALLRHCRANQREYLNLRNDPGARQLEAALTSFLISDLRHKTGEMLSWKVRLQILAYIARYCCVPAVIRTRAAASALDALVGRRFAETFRNRGVVKVMPYCAVPMSQPPLKDLLKHLNSRPERLDFQVDRMLNLRLAPSDMRPFAVELDCSDPARFAFLSERPRFAIAVVNRTAADLTWENDDLTCTFFHVRPVDIERQRQTIIDLIRDADRLEAAILVLPELCLDSDGLHAIVASFRRALHLQMLVAGSCHKTENGKRVNQCVAMIRGRDELLVHNKFSEFSYLDRSGKTITENLHRSYKIRYYLSGCWSLVILICKDFLDKRCHSIMSALGVRVFLIPSFSDKLSPFIDFATYLRQASQAFVVVANSPVPDDEAEGVGIFAAPIANRPVDVVILKRQDAPAVVLSPPNW